MPEIDFEALAAGYDHRPLSESGRLRARTAAAAAGLEAGRVAADVGGGRGRHAGELAGSGARVVVIDRSREMAVAASRVGGVDAIVGDARGLPLSTGSCDLVYFHLSLHYGGWERSLAEAARVARAGGVVWIWTFHPAHHRASFLAQWFPSVGPIDEERFPDPADLEERLGELGCRAVETSEHPEEIERRAGDWIRAVEGGFVSTLQLLAPQEVEAGLDRFRAAHLDPEAILRYRLRYVAVRGTTSR
jgi:ubiquinone/menaquinone biosynthesis C-methylase UbiE